MPSRPRTPRPRANPSRRPRVAGLTPPAPRPDDDARPTAPADDDVAAGPAAARTDASAPRPTGKREGEARRRSRPAEETRDGSRETDRDDRADRRDASRDGGGDDLRDGATTDGPAADRAPGPGAALRRRAVPLLAAAFVVLAAFAAFAAVQDARLRGTPAAQNTALVDVGRTAEVAAQLSDALETVYSYDFARLDENENAAREVITPAFGEQFGRLFTEVRRVAPEQQAVVSATVTLSAVKELTGDRAVLVVFLDQQATRAAPDAQSQQLAAAGRLTVTGERVDGRWKIAAVTPL